MITGTTGLTDLVFQTNPTIQTGISTTSTGFNLINSGATSIQFGGTAQAIDMGEASVELPLSDIKWMFKKVQRLVLMLMTARLS